MSRIKASWVGSRALVLPSLEYCLAPKKQGETKGVAGLLSAGGIPEQSSSVKSETELDKHGQILYDWVKKPASRLRGLMTWQSAGGLPFVSAVHHLASQCFVKHGNMYHEGAEDAVTATEFQRAVRARHRIGSTGMCLSRGDRNDFHFLSLYLY